MKRDQREKKKRRFSDRRITAFLGTALCVALLGAFVWLIWQKSNQRLDTADYEGRIVDRWADYVPSTQRRSEPIFRLVVETKDGKRITVRVDPTIYESARVGMGIKRRNGQVVLIEYEKSERVAAQGRSTKGAFFGLPRPVR